MRNEFDHIKANIKNTRSLARCISLVENETEGHEDFLASIEAGYRSKVIGITGPPGAGKSTLTDALIELWILSEKRVAVLCIDPSSPFHHGAILGDRIRMSTWHQHPNVYIRSLASRGSLGGLHPMTLEITEVLKFAEFDYIIIETVGVGQSEVEIAGLADCTIVVLVPESGDDIQAMKAGLMEIADVFVVNKSDRPGALKFTNELKATIINSNSKQVSVLNVVAKNKSGIEELSSEVIKVLNEQINLQKKCKILFKRTYELIRKKRMSGVNTIEISNYISKNITLFNPYKYVKKYFL